MMMKRFLSCKQVVITALRITFSLIYISIWLWMKDLLSVSVLLFILIFLFLCRKLLLHYILLDLSRWVNLPEWKISRCVVIVFHFSIPKSLRWLHGRGVLLGRWRTSVTLFTSAEKEQFWNPIEVLIQWWNQLINLLLSEASSPQELLKKS